MDTEMFKEFLKDNGYDFSGYSAPNNDRRKEKYYDCVNAQYLDNEYILLGTKENWGEEDGYIKVGGNPFVKYVRHDDVIFKVYARKENGELELEKDLSDEWVKYQIANVENYVQRTFNLMGYIRREYRKEISHKKNLLAQEIERLKEQSNKEINAMQERLDRSEQVLDIIKETVEWGY